MKLQKSFLILFLSLCVIYFSSCASSPDKKIDSVYVMVYDYDNCGVMDASIFMDGKELGKTDIYGRYMFPSDKGKVHTFTVFKEGYEKVEITTSLNPGQLLYFKTGTGTYYAEMAENLLDNGELDEALRMIEKALNIKERKDWLFLKDIIIERSQK